MENEGHEESLLSTNHPKLIMHSNPVTFSRFLKPCDLGLTVSVTQRNQRRSLK